MKITRHNKIKNAPQLSQSILHRRTRQSKAQVTADGFYSLCGLGIMILDVLRFIKKLYGKMFFFIFCNIPQKRRIRGYDNIMLIYFFKLLCAFRHGAGDADRAKLGAETFYFILPVKGQRGRTYYQKLFVFFRLRSSLDALHDGDCLNGFAKPHIIC